MDREVARKLISIVSQEKKYARSITGNDIVNILVYKRKFLQESSAQRFEDECVNEGILSQDGEKFLVNFNAAGEHVPIDFSVDENVLFQQETKDTSLLDKLLNSIVSSGKLTKKEALQKAKKQLEQLEYIDLTIKLCSLMNDLYIDYSDIKKEIEKDIFNIISPP
ncbi:MAG: DUF2240 family protein [Cuniculiplasma sp.]